MKPKVFVTRVIPSAGLDLILEGTEAEVWPGEVEPPVEIISNRVSRVDGLLCLLTDTIDGNVIAASKGRLKVISNYAVGFDNIDIEAATAAKIPVGNTPGVLTETTADLAFSLLMSAARRIVEGDHNARTGGWKTWSPTALLGRDIHGAVLGVLGMGRIGKAVARRAAGFGMKVFFHDPGISRNDWPHGTANVSFEQLISEADFLSLHVPLTEKTRNLMNVNVFAAMKKTAVLVNTARGAIVDQDALYLALETGEIAYAALDVTVPEPLPISHPLFGLSNCLIVPHLGSASVATRDKMAVMAAENLLAGLRGEKLPNCINPEVYDSW